jgi:hypothetical protein
LSSSGFFATFQIIIATNGSQQFFMINYGTLNYVSYANGSFYQYIDANGNIVKSLLPTTPQLSSNVNFNGKWIFSTSSGKLIYIFIILSLSLLVQLFAFGLIMNDQNNSLSFMNDDFSKFFHKYSGYSSKQ